MSHSNSIFLGITEPYLFPESFNFIIRNIILSFEYCQHCPTVVNYVCHLFNSMIWILPLELPAITTIM
jgi:hypothetical protein